MINLNKSSLTLSILTGIFLGTSIIPFPPWAMFFCLSPLFYIWIKEDSPKKVFIYTSLSFFTGTLIGFFWIAHLLTEFALIPFSISALATLVFAFFCHLHFAFLGYIFSRWIKKFTSPSLFLQLLSITSLFSILWMTFPLIFPWNFSLGWLYGGLQGFQFADIFGASGLNAITIFINGASLYSVLMFLKKEKRPLYLTLSFLITFNLAGLFYGKLRITPTKETFTVALGQANIGNFQSFQKLAGPNYKQIALNSYMNITDNALKKQSSDVNLIIWPETAFPQIFTPFFFNTWSGQTLKKYAISKKANILTGTFSQHSNRKISNSALFINKEGLLISPLIHKKILLAFGEYLPGGDTFPFLRSALPMVGDFQPGPSPQVKTIDSTKLGLQICYEGLFPSFSRKLFQKGAELFINLTNDSWYGPYSQPLQHLYTVAFRAIEHRIPFIRSTNTGISTVILPNGSFMESSPLNKKWSHVYQVPIIKNPPPTFYQTFGHFIPLPLLTIMFMISIIYGQKRN